ncbi:polysaccharide biosynthesis/export family protein [Bacteroidales bacterium OttesenSCG-928-J19]|nr:polysaccharide biosynthesis/export family protein [Bacteroidales bacterium OttesenSCG-928-J19]
MKSKFVLFSLLTVVLFSCRSIPKDVTYFEDLTSQSQLEQAINYYEQETRIKDQDELRISVSAAVLDQEDVAQFNLPINSFLTAGETRISATGSLPTYRVDKEGYINFPVLGKVKLGGLTRSQAIALLTEQISQTIKNPIVDLQILSLRVTILGEVGSPGIISSSGERFTIFEAIGAAGEISIYGKRDNVRLIREANGKKEFAVLDLTKADIFSSPYYYLQQNDLIIVDANDTRKKDSKYGASDNYTLSVISTVMGVISLVLTSTITIISLKK